MGKLLIRNRGSKEKPSWEYRFEAASIAGKRRYISKSGFRTKGEAQKIGTAAMAEYNATGRSFAPSSASVADLCTLYLDDYCRHNIADTTFRLWEGIIKNHINPYIGKYKAANIKPAIIQDMVNVLSKSLSKLTARNVLNVTKNVFGYAEKMDLIANNPARSVTIPKNIKKESDFIILSVTQAQTILNHFKGKPHLYFPMLIAYYTGLRVGEAYALTWNDINFKDKTLTVNKSLKYLGNGSLANMCLGKTKTENSNRTIIIGDILLDNLRNWKENQSRNKRLMNGYYKICYGKDDMSENGLPITRVLISNENLDLPVLDFICTRIDGSFSGTVSMNQASKVINQKLGIPFNFHSFRHTHATRMIEAGVPVKTVSQRLGHASINTTLNLYVKVTDRMENEAVRTFEEQFKIS